MEGSKVVISKFPSAKIPRFVSGGLRILQVGVNSARSLPDGDKVDVDLHTQQVTLLPTSTEGLSIPPILLFTKDQTQVGKVMVIAMERKQKQ